MVFYWLTFLDEKGKEVHEYPAVEEEVLPRIGEEISVTEHSLHGIHGLVKRVIHNHHADIGKNPEFRSYKIYAQVLDIQ